MLGSIIVLFMFIIVLALSVATIVAKLTWSPPIKGVA